MIYSFYYNFNLFGWVERCFIDKLFEKLIFWQSFNPRTFPAFTSCIVIPLFFGSCALYVNSNHERILYLMHGTVYLK